MSNTTQSKAEGRGGEEFQEPFDPTRSFESVKEAIDYCNSYPNCIARIEELAHRNIDFGEYGFVRDLLEYI